MNLGLFHCYYAALIVDLKDWDIYLKCPSKIGTKQAKMSNVFRVFFAINFG